MTPKSNHVAPSREVGGWALISSESIKPIKLFDRKSDAVKFGRKLSRAEKSILYIHKKNGLVQDRHVYGEDPLLNKQ